VHASNITPIDWAVIGLYFSILLAVAWWVVRQGKDTAADYFLAGRNLSWWLVGASIFASNIGSEHVVGLAGSGVTDGVAMAHYARPVRQSLRGPEPARSPAAPCAWRVRL